jgi:hypothetical protein
MPLATAGLEKPTLPVAALQIGAQVPPPFAQPTANAYRLPSPDATYTTPPATAGADGAEPTEPVQATPIVATFAVEMAVSEVLKP